MSYRLGASVDGGESGGIPDTSRFFKIDPTSGLLKLTRDLRDEFDDDYNADTNRSSIEIVVIIILSGSPMNTGLFWTINWFRGVIEGEDYNFGMRSDLQGGLG